MTKGFFDDPLIHALRHSAHWLFATALVLLVSVLARVQLIEPIAWEQHCATTPWNGWCTLRSAIIVLIQEQRIGWLASVVGLLAFVNHRRWIAGTAWLSGTCAMLLYAAVPGAFAALFGLLLLIRNGNRTDNATMVINNVKTKA